ncbi:MAG: hypothetical protein K0R84_523 [Clostridia bacterium]|nr:hypothetical protein [Clostridia bacterium]
MAEKYLDNIHLEFESRSQTDCLYSILTSAKLYSGPKFMLSGMSGLAFLFVAHKNLSEPSTEMYAIGNTSRRAARTLGIYSETYDGTNDEPTFPLYQRKAIERMRESIDRGVGVLVWAPRTAEFGIICGYDDEDGVFYFKDRFKDGNSILLYNNVGKVSTGNYWLCQIFEDKVDKDIRDIYMDSLEICVDEWEIPYAPHGGERQARYEFGSGEKAYEFLLRALEGGDFIYIGLRKIISYAVQSKKETYQYLQEVQKEFNGLAPAVLHYKEVNDIFQEMRSIIPERDVFAYLRSAIPSDPPDVRINQKELEKLSRYLRAAKDTEGRGVGEIKKFISEVLDNRFIDAYGVKKFERSLLRHKNF